MRRVCRRRPVNLQVRLVKLSNEYKSIEGRSKACSNVQFAKHSGHIMSSAEAEEHPLRKSVFPGVPPFINYVPQAGFMGGSTLDPGPQYWDPDSGTNKWDQEQLWRFTVAMQVHVIVICACSVFQKYHQGIKDKK